MVGRSEVSREAGKPGTRDLPSVRLRLDLWVLFVKCLLRNVVELASLLFLRLCTLKVRSALYNAMSERVL